MITRGYFIGQIIDELTAVYRYAHDEEGGFAAGERYLPDGMASPGFYRPVERGLEIRIAEKLRRLRELDRKSEGGGAYPEPLHTKPNPSH